MMTGSGAGTSQGSLGNPPVVPLVPGALAIPASSVPGLSKICNWVNPTSWPPEMTDQAIMINRDTALPAGFYYVSFLAVIYGFNKAHGYTQLFRCNQVAGSTPTNPGSTQTPGQVAHGGQGSHLIAGLPTQGVGQGIFAHQNSMATDSLAGLPTQGVGAAGSFTYAKKAVNQGEPILPAPTIPGFDCRVEVHQDSNGKIISETICTPTHNLAGLPTQGLGDAAHGQIGQTPLITPMSFICPPGIKDQLTCTSLAQFPWQYVPTQPQDAPTAITTALINMMADPSTAQAILVNNRNVGGANGGITDASKFPAWLISATDSPQLQALAADTAALVPMLTPAFFQSANKCSLFSQPPQVVQTAVATYLASSGATDPCASIAQTSPIVMITAGQPSSFPWVAVLGAVGAAALVGGGVYYYSKHKQSSGMHENPTDTYMLWRQKVADKLINKYEWSFYNTTRVLDFEGPDGTLLARHLYNQQLSAKDAAQFLSERPNIGLAPGSHRLPPHNS